MSLDIDSIVRITARIAPQPRLARDFGRGLLFTVDPTLAPIGAGRVQEFASYNDVLAVFPANSEPAKCANAWFSQNPYPKNLLVARWSKTAVPTEIRGGRRLATTLAQFQAISDGSFNLNGTDVTGVDLSGQTSMAEIASALQTALRGTSVTDWDAAEVSYEAADANRGDRFVVKFAKSGAPVALSASQFGAHSAATGTDLSSRMKLRPADGAEYAPGVETPETVPAALSAIIQLNDNWYWLLLDATEIASATVLSVAAWAESQTVLAALDNTQAGALTAAENTSYAAQLAAFDYERTLMVWSKTADYKAASIAARFSSVDFSNANSLITAKFKLLPGTLADDLTPTQKAELDRKRVNHYSPYSRINMFAEGTLLRPGSWIEARYWLDWFVNQVQTDIFNVLSASNKLPQTDAGLAALIDTVDAVCERGVANGGIAPGALAPALVADIRVATTNSEFSGTLTLGYLVYAPEMASQSPSDRAARRSPTIRVWLKGSGAIHSVNADITFEN